MELDQLLCVVQKTALLSVVLGNGEMLVCQIQAWEHSGKVPVSDLEVNKAPVGHLLWRVPSSPCAVRSIFIAIVM